MNISSAQNYAAVKTRIELLAIFAASSHNCRRCSKFQQLSQTTQYKSLIFSIKLTKLHLQREKYAPRGL